MREGPSTRSSPGASRSRSTATGSARRRCGGRRAQARPSRHPTEPAPDARGGRPLPAVLFSSPRKDGLKGAIRIAVSRNRPEPVKKAFVKSYGCQMNVYDAERMADVLATEGYAETADDRGGGPRHPQHLPHPREGCREGLFRARPRPRAQGARAAGGSGRRWSSRAASPRRRVRRSFAAPPPSDVVVGPQSYHRLPELLSKATTGRVVDTEFPVEDKFDHLPAPSAPAIRSRGVSAFLTIQEGCDKFCTFCVVPYTRGAEVSRPVAQDHRGGATPCGGRRPRDHPHRPERERLSRRGRERGGLVPRTAARTARRLCRGSHACATRRATPGHGREPDRRPPRPAGRDALPAPAGPVGLGPDPRGHEPPASGRRVPPHRRARAHGPPRHRPLVGLHRRLSGRDGRGFRGHDAARGGYRLRRRLLVQVQPAAGTPAAELDGQVPEPVKAERLARLQELLETQRQAFNRGTVGALSTFFWRSRAGIRASSPASRPISRRCRSKATRAGIGEIVAVRIARAGSNSLFGERVGRDALNAAA